MHNDDVWNETLKCTAKCVFYKLLAFMFILIEAIVLACVRIFFFILFIFRSKAKSYEK